MFGNLAQAGERVGRPPGLPCAGGFRAVGAFPQGPLRPRNRAGRPRSGAGEEARLGQVAPGGRLSAQRLFFCRRFT